MLLLDALESFLRQCDANGRSIHTRRQYQRHVALLASWAQREGLPPTLEALDHEVLARFLASPCVKRSARGTPRKPTSANALRTSLRTFFGYTRQAGFVDRDPARLVRRARTGIVPPRGLTIEQRDRLLGILATAVGDEARRDRVLFTLMLGCGIRIGSALALDVEDLDLAGGRIRLRQVKNGGEQEAFLPVALRDEVAALVGERPIGPLFLSRNGRRITMRQVQRRLGEWLERAGVQGRFSPHSLRHTFATELYRRTRDVALVQAALGHASITSTMVYARADSQSVREAIGAA